MARTHGSTNKQQTRVPETVAYSTQQKLQFLVHLMVAKMAEDQAKNRKLLKRIKKEVYGTGVSPAA